MRLLLALALVLPVSAQTVTRVSVSSSGQEGDGPTTAVTISESGRWVAMQSSATNLVSGDSNGVDDIFLHDRNWGTTTRISVATSEAEANGPSAVPSLSGSGERIAFESTATNLVGGYGPAQQIYVHDRVALTTVAASSVAGNGASSEAQVSLDGQWVVFQSDATNLVGGDTNGATDVFLAEVTTGATTRVSVTTGGTEGNGASTRPTVSADGRWVTFVSSVSNLVSGDTNGADDLFLHDTLTGQTTRVSTTSAGAQANGQTVAGTISPDGGYVALASDASNLVFEDTNGVRDIFVKVLGSGLVVRVSVSSSGTQASSSSFFPGVSWYGSEVSFHTLASLVPGDTNGQRDVYKHSLDSGLTTLISATPSGTTASGTSWLADLDTGGRVTVFQSDAPDLVAGDTNGVSDAFVQLEKATWYIDVAGAGSGTGTQGNPYMSIQYAIDRPQTVGGDELLVAAGTYDENLDLRGKSLTLRSLGGKDATILDGDQAGTVMVLSSGEGPGTVVEGFTIRHGIPLHPQVRGGGLLCRDSAARIEGCLIDSNSANEGAGVACEDADLVLAGTVLRNNSAAAYYLGRGAGVFGSDSRITIEDCLFDSNVTAQPGSALGWWGGGIYVEGSSLVVSGSVFEANFGSTGGGGIAALSSDLSLVDSLFEGNSAGWYSGGGVLFLGSALGGQCLIQDCEFNRNEATVAGYTGGGVSYGGGAGSSFRLVDSVFRENLAASGGGVALGGEADVRGCTFLRNEAVVEVSGWAANGGGLWADSPVSVSECLFVDNTADDSVFPRGHAVSGPAQLTRCTISSSDTPPVASAGAVGVLGATLTECIVWNAGSPELGSTSDATYSDVQGGFPGTGNIDEDPLFWDPEGGDFHLMPGSPCIDAGDPTSPLDPDGSIADMGAFPFDPDYCPPATNYCTAGTTGNGCMATISATGTPSATAASGFDVSVSNVEGQKQGIIFWGLTGKAAPWGGGTSWLCVQAPAKRTGTQDSGGTAGQCDGSFSLDFNAWMAANPGKAPGLGEVIYMQAWFRDPPSPKTTSLSDGLRFVVCQ